VKTVEKTLPRAGKKVEPAGTDGGPARRNYERRGGGFNDDERGERR